MSKTLDSYGYKVTLDNENFSSKIFVIDNIFSFLIINTKLEDGKTEEILDFVLEKSPDTKILVFVIAILG